MARRIQLHPEVTLARLEEALKAPLPKKKRRRLEAMRLALIRKAAAALRIRPPATVVQIRTARFCDRSAPATTMAMCSSRRCGLKNGAWQMFTQRRYRVPRPRFTNRARMRPFGSTSPAENAPRWHLAHPQSNLLCPAGAVTGGLAFVETQLAVAFATGRQARLHIDDCRAR